MLQHHVEYSSPLRHDIVGGPAWLCLKGSQNRSAYSVTIRLSLLQGWPLVRNFRVPMTLAGIDIRIDTAAKELVEVRIERRPFENAAANLIPRECWQVTHVEKKRMPPHNRFGQQPIIANQTEQFITLGPSREETRFVLRIAFVDFS